MRFSDEVVMAYADEELEPSLRSRVEQAMASDAELAQRIAAQRALRTRLEEHYAPVLGEPVPERLLTLLRAPQSVRGSAASGSHVGSGNNIVPLRRPRRLTWQLTALAASIAFGVLIGTELRPFNSGAPVISTHGQLVASGALAAALSRQLASDQRAGSAVHIGISYLARDGQYCRTFELREEQDFAGIACRDAQDWRVKMIEGTGTEPAANGPYRQAASSLPDAVREIVESEIRGDPLDARAEAAARSRGWRQTSR